MRVVNDMELRELRAFVEVVRQGGFSSAAKAIFATQSTVSKAVKQLEEDLGVTLLERTSRGNKLTAAGDIVYARALSMLAQSDDLVAELGELRGLKRGILRLGLPAIGSGVLFAPLFATYRNLYPGVEIRLFEHGSKRLEEMVLSGEIELAGSLLPVRDEFEWQAVRREPIDVLIAPGHPLAANDSVTVGMLHDVPFILFEAGFALNPIILDACRQSGFEPAVAARASQVDFIVELVAAGVGVAFLPRMIAEERAHAGVRRIAVAEPPMEWHMALIWRRGGYLSDAARAWKELVGAAVH